MYNLLAGSTSMILSLVIGFVVAIVIFGLLFLLAILPTLRGNKKNSAAPDEKEVKSVDEELVEEEKVFEELEAEEPVKEEPAPVEETVEKPVEEVKEEPVEEVKEEPVKEEKAKEPEPAVKEELAAAAAEEEEEPEESEDEEDDDVEDSETLEAKQARLAAIESAPELEADQRYNRSYKSRLIQSSDTIKGWYSEIKNEALGYKGVKGTISWRQEKLHKGRTVLAKIALRGKTLSIYLPIGVNEVKNYDVEDVSDKAVHAATPTLFRIKKEAHANQAVELINQVAAKLGLEELQRKRRVDYVQEYALETTEKLIEEELIKVVYVKK